MRSEEGDLSQKKRASQLANISNSNSSSRYGAATRRGATSTVFFPSSRLEASRQSVASDTQLISPRNNRRRRRRRSQWLKSDSLNQRRR